MVKFCNSHKTQGNKTKQRTRQVEDITSPQSLVEHKWYHYSPRENKDNILPRKPYQVEKRNTLQARQFKEGTATRTAARGAKTK